MKKYDELMNCQNQFCSVMDWEVVSRWDAWYWSPICSTCRRTYNRSKFNDNEKSKSQTKAEKEYRKILKNIQNNIESDWINIPFGQKKDILIEFMKHCANDFELKKKLELNIEELESQSGKKSYGNYKDSKQKGTVTLNKHFINEFVRMLNATAHEVAHARQHQEVELFLENEQLDFKKKPVNSNLYDPQASLWNIEFGLLNDNHTYEDYRNTSCELVARNIAFSKLQRLNISM